MQGFIQRITFYFRNEMTHDVEMRIEAVCIARVMLACLAVVGWQFYTLHRINREAAERETARFEKMEYFIGLTDKQERHTPEKATPKLSFRYQSQRSQKTVETTERKRMDIFDKRKLREIDETRDQ